MIYTREDWFFVLVGLVIFLAVLLLVNAWACLSYCSREEKKEAQRREIERQSPRVLRKVFPDEMDIELALEIVNRRDIA